MKNERKEKQKITNTMDITIFHDFFDVTGPTIEVLLCHREYIHKSFRFR